MPATDELSRQQAAFDAVLEGILPEHQGEFVVFHDEPVRYFKTFGDAYAAGLETFGLDEVFLVQAVEKKGPGAPVSMAWQAGVMFTR